MASHESCGLFATFEHHSHIMLRSLISLSIVLSLFDLISAAPLLARASGDPAPIDVRIWALPNTNTSTAILTTVNGQEVYDTKSSQDYRFQPAIRPAGSDQDYELVGVMTFYTVPETPRAVVITDNTPDGGASCTVFFTQGSQGKRQWVDWFIQHSIERKPSDMVIECKDKEAGTDR